jgi:ABC-type branched-subunit amino acid transport system substrate-binding protein
MSTDRTAIVNAIKSTATFVDTAIGTITFDSQGDAVGGGIGFSTYSISSGAFLLYD